MSHSIFNPSLSFLLAGALSLLLSIQANSQDVLSREMLSSYVENTSVFGQGQVDPRAWYIPSDAISLDGQWKFSYYESPLDVPGDFFRKGFNDRKWDSITVPSNWEMQGFGEPLFRNVTTPFPQKMPAKRLEELRRTAEGKNPSATERDVRMARYQLQSGDSADPFAVNVPSVPMDLNPTGAYRRTFSVPSSWKGERIFLRFEKVASASFVWVNGELVGYNEGAQEPSEYDITSFVKTGGNTLAVLVLKYSDGYYLEGQDYWRLAGIFDHVWLYRTGQVRLFDYHVVTDFGKDYKDSDVSLDVDVRSYDTSCKGLNVRGTISRNGSVVKTMASSPFDLSPSSKAVLPLRAKVESPLKWSSETPNLYDLSIELLSPEGKVIDRIDKRMGFKKTEIIDGVFYLNGVPLKLSAQCSHMQHPLTGHTMDRETIIKDMQILRQFNFNAVRTSHYPPVNEYLDLADEFGLFIIDETGDESHATEYVSSMEEFFPMYRERARQMVLRDRNHPCVLFWSAGNESGEGQAIYEVIAEGKKYDSTRYWMYGGNAPIHPAEEIVGPRYPSPIEHEIRYGMDTTDKRPSFMDEYLSVAGNGGGAMDEYWDEIYSHPKLMGGAIWDFVSVGLLKHARALEDKSPVPAQAVIMGGATLVKGPWGNAIDLNKQDQWVQIYREDKLESFPDGITISFDVYPRLFSRSGGYYIMKGKNQFGVKQEGSDNLLFFLTTDRKYELRCPLPSSWEGSWHKVRATYDGLEMTLRIDEGPAVSTPATGRIRNYPQSICLGRDEEKHGQETVEYICDALLDNFAIAGKAIVGDINPEEALLYLDFEKQTDLGPYYSYGIGARTYGSIWPDRVPQPEMWQMKHTTQPLRFNLLDPENGVVEVWNRNHFTSASTYRTTWKLLSDDSIVDSGELSLDTAPLKRETFTIGYSRPTRIVPGKEYRLEISYCLKEDTPWAKAGFEVGWDQFELEGWNQVAQVSPPPKGRIDFKEEDGTLSVIGEGFTYKFENGKLTGMEVGGKTLLLSPLNLNLWRAPLANELDSWNSYSAGNYTYKPGYGSIGNHQVLAGIYYGAGLDRPRAVPMSCRARKAGDAVYIDSRELVTIGEGNARQLDAYISGVSYDAFECIYSYSITPDGTIRIATDVKPQGNMPPWLPRLGFTTTLDESLRLVNWYGRGPQANYPDRNTGYRVGIYSNDIDDMYEPYLIPQDYGLRTDNRWVTLTDAEGDGLRFSIEGGFNFNAYPLSTDNLTKAVYQYQLKKSPFITLNLDFATSGVGCTARGIFQSYRVYPEAYHRTITISPVRK